MISIHPRLSASTSSPRRTDALVEQRVKVTSRIALFEQAPLMNCTIPSLSSHLPARKTIAHGDAKTVHSFLSTIGENEACSVTPTLWRLASEWKQQIRKRVDERKTDKEFYSISASLDHLDAILYSDCTWQEIEALELVAVASTSVYQEEINDDEEEKEETDESDESSVVFNALENGIKDLANELDSFTTSWHDQR